MENSDIRNFYRVEKERFTEMYRADLRALNIMSGLRLVLFLVGFAAAILLFRIGNFAGILSIITAIGLFLWIIRVFGHRSWLRDYNLNMIRVNENELKSLDGDYSQFNSGSSYIDPSHDFSHDIDIFGRNSLFQYLDRTCSYLGGDILAGWLMNPYEISSDYTERAEAINELSKIVGWRQRFIGLGLMNKTANEDRLRLNSWLSERPVFRNEKLVRACTILLPSVSILLLVLGIAGIVGFEAFVLSFLFNLTLLAFSLKKINAVHNLVSKQYFALHTIKSLLEHLNNVEFTSSLLNKIKDRMEGSDIGALDSIARLSKIIQTFDSRLNMLAGVILNGLFLMDFISVLRLEKWKREVKSFIPGWFDDLGSIDALISLANFAYNNPCFCYPETSESEVFFEATGLGHPLIMEDRRVVNDFILGKRGEITIITGANMAGKSTFLRTVAINTVLAMAGAPVCAERFRYTPSKIYTSMRTSDSLSESESYFYAELKRLRHLKERIVRKEPLLFILDEILKGTNSKDKSEGSRLFIEKIIKYNATGIVATHDIVLGDLEKTYPKSIKNLCFEITIEGEKIAFDYLLRSGVTTRMNAAILMRQHGIID